MVPLCAHGLGQVLRMNFRYVAQRIHWMDYLVQLQVQVLKFVLRESQKMDGTLATTSLRQQSILTDIQLLISTVQNAVVERSGHLRYIEHG